MKPWIKRSLFGIFGASILVGGLTACGHRHHDYGASMSTEQYTQIRSKVVDRATSNLELNAEQQKLLTALADKLYEQRTALMGQAKDPRAEVKSLVAVDKFDRARALTLISEKTAAMQAQSPEVIAALGDFYDSLNPAQQQKVRDFMEGRGRWFHRG
jgi:Spy/CpxP family protein refolding chaperone